jgi:hypothetical protein
LLKLISGFAAHLDESLKRKRIKTSGKKAVIKSVARSDFATSRNLKLGARGGKLWTKRSEQVGKKCMLV